jgi:hypothetical protein
MRWINRAIVVAAVLTISAISAWAQDQACTEDYLNETYTKWYEPYSHREDPKQKDAAYQIAKEYVNKCPNEFADNAYAKALKSYVQVYEKAQASGEVAKNFETAVTSKNYADQIKFGKQLVAMPSNADNAVIYIIMAGAGLGDANQLAESAQAAKKAIELVEGGKPFTPAYQTKDQALAAMNYVIAKSLIKTPTDAIPYFVKALRYESDLKKSPVVYNELATAYGEGPVDKFAKDYKALADAGKPVDSPEIKLVVANLNQAFDAQIDAFARAAAVSTAPADKQAFMKVLGEVYKDRNHADATPEQLNTLVASALSKPVPDAPKTITELPAGTTTPGGTSATPTNGSGNGAPTAGGGAPAGAPKPTATAPTSSTSTKPAASGSTTPAKPTATPKPRQRAHHRG